MHNTCTLCHSPLKCSCGTWDNLHEGSCEKQASLCEACVEYLADGLPIEEPGPPETDIKELTGAELDAAAACGRIHYAAYDEYRNGIESEMRNRRDPI